MRTEQSTTPSWQVILLLVLGVAVVVIIALLLAQMDTFQRRSAVPSNGPQVTDLEATVAAGDLATIYLHGTESPLPTSPATPTLTDSTPAEMTPEVPTAEVDANCVDAVQGRPIYIVKPGETLASIAARFSVSEDVLRQTNCLSHDRLIQGQQIYLPGDSTILSPLSGQCDGPPGWKPHRVVPGDTLPKLARAYRTSVYYIVKANCLEIPQLLVDSEILLPDINLGLVGPQADN